MLDVMGLGGRAMTGLGGHSMSPGLLFSFQDFFFLQLRQVGLFLPSHQSWLLSSPQGTIVETGEVLSFSLDVAQQVLPTPSDHPEAGIRTPFYRQGNSLREGRSPA